MKSKWHYLPEKPSAQDDCILRLKDRDDLSLHSSFNGDYFSILEFEYTPGKGLTRVCERILNDNEVLCWCSFDDLTSDLDDLCDSE